VALFSFHRSKVANALLGHPLRADFRRDRLSRLKVGDSRTQENCATPGYFILHGVQDMPAHLLSISRYFRTPNLPISKEMNEKK